MNLLPKPRVDTRKIDSVGCYESAAAVKLGHGNAILTPTAFLINIPRGSHRAWLCNFTAVR
jgi:hypothetical protein